MHICMQHMVLVLDACFPENFACNCKMRGLFFSSFRAEKSSRQLLLPVNEELPFRRTIQAVGLNESNIVTLWRRIKSAASLLHSIHEVDIPSSLGNRIK